MLSCTWGLFNLLWYETQSIFSWLQNSHNNLWPTEQFSQSDCGNNGPFEPWHSNQGLTQIICTNKILYSVVYSSILFWQILFSSPVAEYLEHSSKNSVLMEINHSILLAMIWWWIWMIAYCHLITVTFTVVLKIIQPLLQIRCTGKCYKLLTCCNDQIKQEQFK